MTATKAPYAKLKPALDAAFSAVMASMDFENGPQVTRFARSLENYLQVPLALPSAHAAAALKAALRLLQLPRGAEVIVPAFGDAALVAVLQESDYLPVLADVDAQTFTLTSATVEKVITPTTAAILVTHLFGQCAPLQELVALAQQHKLWLIEDATQALGARYKMAGGEGGYAGIHGHLGITSFFPTKPLLDAGEGAAVLVNDAGLVARLQEQQEGGRAYPEEHISLGALEAAMMEVKLTFVEEYNAARQTIAKYYDQAFAAVAEIQTPAHTHYAEHIYQQYTIAVAPELRDGLRRHLEANYIPSAVYYPAPQGLSLSRRDFPTAARLSESILCLPLHSELKEEQLAYICQHVINYVKQNSAF